MRQWEWPSRERVVEAVQSRFFFQNRLATGLVITIIMLWYLVQFSTLFLGWDEELIQWMFTTESFPVLSPGLGLAIISHAFPPQVTHLFANIALLWLFAGESEQHMGQLEVGGFFVATALASVLGSTAISDESTMGASGGALAFIGFYCVHMLLEHRDEFEWETLGSRALCNTPLTAYWGLFLALTPIVGIPYMLGQHVGLLPAGRANTIGHLIGFVVGMKYAVVRSERGPHFIIGIRG